MEKRISSSKLTSGLAWASNRNRRAYSWLLLRHYPMWLALSLSLSGLACSSSAAKKGALDPGERANYIENYGTKTSWEVRRAFIKGQIVPGMTKDLVVFLVGDPDRTAVESFGVSWGESLDSLTGQADTRDSIWEYLDGPSGGVRFGLRFQDDTVSKVEGQP